MSRKSRAESAAALDAATTTEPGAPGVAAAALPAEGAEIVYRELPLERVFPSPLNPRKHVGIDDLPSLGRSIAEKGLLQPIMVRPARGIQVRQTGEPLYEVILGSRRVGAAGWAVEQGLLPRDYAIPARIRDCSDDELVIFAGVENFDREDMEPLDEAELFAAIRPRVAPQPGETREAAVARLFHIGERTVFRRLALLRCDPAVQQALRAGEITLGAATAFSLGDPQKQREVLDEHRRRHKYGHELPTPGDIRYELVERSDDRIPVDRAIFDPADYHGAIVDDPDSGDRYFADIGEFKRLQELALAAMAEELQATWPWVEVVRSNFTTDGYRTWNVDAGDPGAGALILISSNSSVTVHAPALKVEKAPARPSAAGPPASRSRSPLSAAQVRHLHQVKTQALRRAVIEPSGPAPGNVALALACLGLLGAREIRDMAAAAYHPGYNRVGPAASAEREGQRLQDLVKTVGGRRRAGLADSGYDSADAAGRFAALLDLPTSDLVELHARLVAERVGSWVLGDGFGNYNDDSDQLGDTPLAMAIAAASGAEVYLAELWRPDLAWFQGYGRVRLAAIVRDQLKIRNADKMRKGELAQLCVEQPQGFWQPWMFPECRFQSEQAAIKALAAPPPAVP